MKDHKKKQRLHIKMRTGLWIGFLGLGAGISVLFFSMLLTGFRTRYTQQSDRQLKKAAWEIVREYGDDNFENTLAVLSRSDGYTIQVISEKNHKVLTGYTGNGEKFMQADTEVTKGVFSRLDQSDGYCFYRIRQTDSAASRRTNRSDTSTASQNTNRSDSSTTSRDTNRSDFSTASRDTNRFNSSTPSRDTTQTASPSASAGSSANQDIPDNPENNTENGTSQYAAAIVLANHNGYREILVISHGTAEIDGLMQLLYRRGYFVLAISMAVAFFIGLLLARFYAHPFANMDKEAQKMGQGKFDAHFREDDGPLEAVRLAKTLNQAEREFQENEQIRRDFIANISHDMKTPLTVIKAYAEMLDTFSADIPEKRSEHLNRILTETDHMTDLINELLELSSLQAGVIRLHYETYSLNAQVSAVLDRIRLKDYADNFDLKLYADRQYQIHADRQLIHRALYNLVSNAVKYSGNSREVYVTITSISGNHVRVQVIDHGIGIAPEDQPHIWERFYRSPDTGNQIRGNGIGLNIVAEIFRYHHFDYGVISTPGKGSIFWFTFN